LLPPPPPPVTREAFYGLAIQHRLPTIGALSEGSLLAYGPNMVDLYRRASSYIDRILRGAKVNELPVEFPTRFQLVINLKTAKALGLAVPPTLLALADEVIE